MSKPIITFFSKTENTHNLQGAAKSIP